jgi:serine/threonine-protein kinase
LDVKRKPRYRRFELALAHSARKDSPAADAALTELIVRDRNVMAYQVAEVYAWRGETDKGFEWLQISLDNHDTGLLSLLIDPLMRSLRHDSRYSEMLSKVGLPPSEGVAVNIFSVTPQNLSYFH